MTQHTPGPWHISSVVNDLFCKDEVGDLWVAHIRKQGGDDALVAVYGPTNEQVHADTNLIKMAPELLSVMKRMYAAFEDIVPTGEQAVVLQEAYTIIVLAGGGEVRLYD